MTHARKWLDHRDMLQDVRCFTQQLTAAITSTNKRIKSATATVSPPIVETASQWRQQVSGDSKSTYSGVSMSTYSGVSKSTYSGDSKSTCSGDSKSTYSGDSKST